MQTQEQNRILELARKAKRQPWRAANIRAGEVTLADHYDDDGVTPEGHEARRLFDAYMADPAVEPANEELCDYCGKPLEDGRQNCCKACAVERD